MKRLRRFWWRRIRRYAYEICRDCGRPVGLVWSTPDALWQRIWGDEGGVLCLPCFDSRCCTNGIYLHWISQALKDALPWRTHAALPATDLEQLREALRELVEATEGRTDDGVPEQVFASHHRWIAALSHARDLLDGKA